LPYTNGELASLGARRGVRKRAAPFPACRPAAKGRSSGDILGLQALSPMAAWLKKTILTPWGRRSYYRGIPLFVVGLGDRLLFIPPPSGKLLFPFCEQRLPLWRQGNVHLSLIIE